MSVRGPIAVVLFTAMLGAAACSDPKVLTGMPGPLADAALPEGSSGDAGGGGDADTASPPDGSAVPSGGAIGEPCGGDGDCRSGLTCEAAACAPTRTGKRGDPCWVSPECEDGLQCVDRSCVAAGASAVGEACQTDADCESALRCAIVGFSAQCVAEGSADVGQACSSSKDCLGGLLCSEAACAPVPTGLPSFGIVKSPELKCAEESDGPVVAHFEIPGAPGTETGGDFFRLPFPNDIRIRGGAIDLKGFPTPGVSPLVGVDPVKIYVNAIAAEQSGWGTSPTVFFRFSGRVDSASLRQKGEASSPVRWIDVTDPLAPRNAGLTWQLDPNPTAYICPNWLAVRRPLGSPLEPGRTYAVWVTTDALDNSGEPVQAAPQFSAMLSDRAPKDPILEAAWDRYAPFRTYIHAEGIDPGTVLVGTVITPADPRRQMAAVASTVHGLGDPAPADWVRCEPDVESPCPDAEGDRGCGPPDGAYDEYHAVVDFPIFQRGEAPYLEEGGSIQTFGYVRTEPVCVSLTVPKAAPKNGRSYPVVVYGHGTGGSFRSHVRPEVAGALSVAETPGGSVPVAVLGYDAVQHGPRRGGSRESPNNLFFNFTNPAAALGNVLQGAADVIWAGRIASKLRVPAEITGGKAVSTDASAILYFGHSQGAMHGTLGLAYTDDYTTAVLSGSGASLLHALRRKRQPVDVASAVPLVIGDYRIEDGQVELPGGDSHPVLSLVQQWIDPGDPLNFANALTTEPIASRGPKHVFQTYGHGDTYSPDVTLRIFAIAAGLAVAEADESVTEPADIGGRTPQSVPLADTDGSNATEFTYGVRQYAPAAGKDGHFVVFDVAAANRDAVRFLGMAANGQVPQIGP